MVWNSVNSLKVEYHCIMKKYPESRGLQNQRNVSWSLSGGRKDVTFLCLNWKSKSRERRISFQRSWGSRTQISHVMACTSSLVYVSDVFMMMMMGWRGPADDDTVCSADHHPVLIMSWSFFFFQSSLTTCLFLFFQKTWRPKVVDSIPIPWYPLFNFLSLVAQSFFLPSTTRFSFTSHFLIKIFILPWKASWVILHRQMPCFSEKECNKEIHQTMWLRGGQWRKKGW